MFLVGGKMAKFKLLVITSYNNPDKAVHAVDLWRSGRNIRELKKHVDWEITERPTIMKFIEKYQNEKDFTEEELQKTIDDLAQFDMVFGSYTAFMNNMVFALCKLVEDKYGTKFVLDVDDNLFAVKPDNIGWWMHMNHETTWDLQTVVLKSTHLITTNEKLAAELRKRRDNPNSVFVVPNYISSDYKTKPDGHEYIRIGYFGGSSHYEDLHKTGVISALERLMHEFKDLRFVSVGMPVEDYLPKKRYEYNHGTRGHGWVNKIFPALNFDIAIAPLTVDKFTECKSDIKWQESAMMKAAVVATDVRPYRETIRNNVDGLLVKNTEKDWYNALRKLVVNQKLREGLAQNAYDRVNKEFLIENNWTVFKDAIEKIKEMK